MLEAVPWENPTYGISGGRLETWPRAELRTHPATESTGLEILRLRVRAPVPYPTDWVRDLRTGEDLPSLLELAQNVEVEVRAHAAVEQQRDLAARSRRAAEAWIAALEALRRAVGAG